jgi:hypothetical protein
VYRVSQELWPVAQARAVSLLWRRSLSRMCCVVMYGSTFVCRIAANRLVVVDNVPTNPNEGHAPVCQSCYFGLITHPPMHPEDQVK